MKSKLWTLILCVSVAGCGSINVRTECDWTKPLYFESVATIDWLLLNDRRLLEDIITQNEVRRETCR